MALGASLVAQFPTESAIEGALRESFEEANITSGDIEVVGAYREDHGNWCYTTVFAFEKLGHSVNPCAHDDEYGN